MDQKPAILLNVAHGNGPYLRMSELALTINDLLERRGQTRHQIIVPLLYGERQKRIMQEHFGSIPAYANGEIILDETYGRLLREILFEGEAFENSLKRWSTNVTSVEKKIATHLRNTYGNSIALQLHRAPFVRLPYTAPSFMISFASNAEIWKRAAEKSDIATNAKLLNDCSRKMQEIENIHHIYFIAVPGTFQENDGVTPFPRQIATPPTIPDLPAHTDAIAKGIYVTVTGIPGLSRLYTNLPAFGLKLYSTNPEAVKGAIAAPQSILKNPAIAFHYARPGWSSVWLSLLSGTPMLLPPFDTRDDPEIYFNTLAVQKLGIGMVYNGQSLHEILDAGTTMRTAITECRESLLKRFKTLDGLTFVARRIVEEIPGKH